MRYRTIWMVLLVVLVQQGLKAQNFSHFTEVVNDTFANKSQLVDLTSLMLWGNQTQPKSALRLEQKADSNGLSFPSICLTDSGMQFGGSAGNPIGLKTASGFDYLFPSIDRTNDTILLQFDALWAGLSSNGEGGRIVAAFMWDYPQAPAFGVIDSLQLYHPFGRPAYNVRILNKALSNPESSYYLFYGGGADSLGESEKTADFWLPGFIAQPPGVAPSSGSQYPRSPTRSDRNAYASNEQWRRFSMLLLPNRLEFYWKPSGQSTGGLGTRITFMELPNKQLIGTAASISQLNAAHGTNITSLPTFYRYFPTIDGIRFYFRANTRAYLANVKVLTSATTTSTAQLQYKPALKLYPNPVGDYFIPLVTGTGTLQVFDLQGREIINTQVESNVAVPTANLRSGTYMARFSNAQGSATQRFVKQ